jgi:molecular chaperone GrpE (heat shock protein)
LQQCHISFRQQARGELDSQKGYGRIAAVRTMLPFAETFESLQEGAEADGEEGAAIHKFYGGIYKQTQQLLETWQVVPYMAEAGAIGYHGGGNDREPRR